MNKTELRPAYVWDCPDCGQQNFERAIVPSIDPDQETEMKLAHGQPPDAEGVWLLAIEYVTCRGCQRTFPTQFQGLHEEDDDEQASS